MQDAIKQLKYRPSLDGAVGAGVDTPGLKAEARSADAQLRAKADGALVVTLVPKAGHQLGGEGQTPTKVEVVGTDAVKVPEGQGQVSIGEALTAKRELRIPIRIDPKATAGEQLVTVKVTFQSKAGGKAAAERTVEFRVPVVVQ